MNIRPEHIGTMRKAGRLWTPLWFLFALAVAVITFLQELGVLHDKRFESTDLSVAAGTIILGLITNALADASVESVRSAQRPFVVAAKPGGEQAARVVGSGGHLELAVSLRNIGRGPAIVVDVSMRDAAGYELVDLPEAIPLAVEREAAVRLPLADVADVDALPASVDLRVFCIDIDGLTYVGTTTLERSGRTFADSGYELASSHYYDLDQGAQ